ncbi:MAG: alpha/beta fold hydrolase [Pseudomonadota bacterium]
MLNRTTYGDAAQPRLLIVHGLFGSGRNWGVIAKRLSDQYLVTTVDMRNHGTSFRADTQTYHYMADDLARVLKEIGPSNVVGHSMGGKAGMVLALAHPELVERLVVADIAPVTYSHTQAHLIEFMRKIDLSKVNTRRDADRQLAAFIEEDGIRAFLLQSLDVKARKWRLNLDVLDAQMADIIGFPEVSGQYTGPTLFLSGGASDYVLPEHRPAIKPLFPKAKFAKIPDVGHWLHAEKPREFEATLRVFLERG